MFDDDDLDYPDIYEPEEYAPENTSTNGKTATPKPSLLVTTGQAIVKSSPWQAIIGVKKQAGELSAKYPNAIRHTITICDALISFYKRRNIVSLFRGGFQIFETIQSSNLYNFYQFARAADGFRYLSSNKTNIAFLFKDVLEKFPKEKITFKNNETVDQIKIPLGDVYWYLSGETAYIYYNQNLVQKDALIQFLVDEKFKDLESNFLYLQTKENEHSLTLSALKPDIRTSIKANEITNTLKQFNDAGINRSIFLYGVPGVGKTSMAFKVLNALNYRTIVFSASNKLCTFDLIRNLIDLLKIDALIVDDFDQLSSSNKTLDMLEMFNKKLKVLIGIANSLKDFHVAILRPGRFDSIILVDQLDDTCISSVLGDLTETYMPLVRKWPIAFINELAKNRPFMNDKELMAYAEELNGRVRSQVGLSAVGKLIPLPQPTKPVKKTTTKKATPKKATKTTNKINSKKLVEVDDELTAALNSAAEFLNGLSSEERLALDREDWDDDLDMDGTEF